MSSVVLLSGGLDSAVCLAQAVREGGVKLCITFNYGQHAARREIEAASALAHHYGLSHVVVDLPFLGEVSDSALTGRTVSVPQLAENDLEDVDLLRDTASAVWVPNRNGVFVNIAAAFAEAMNCDTVVAGFNREEAATFPDNSVEFVEAVNTALKYSTRSKVRLVSYTLRLDKREIVRLGKRLKVPFELIWSCYLGGEEMCGKCESCRRFLRAVSEAGAD